MKKNLNLIATWLYGSIAGATISLIIKNPKEINLYFIFVMIIILFINRLINKHYINS